MYDNARDPWLDGLAVMEAVAAGKNHDVNFMINTSPDGKILAGMIAQQAAILMTMLDDEDIERVFARIRERTPE